MEALKRVFAPGWKLINAYPAVVAAIAIYLYYLITSMDFFEHASEKKNFLDYVLQFDSLIWMWIAAAALLQMQRYRKRQKEESEQRQVYQYELQLQQAQSDMLNDITALLQDAINNPLAIISLKTQEIRRRFEGDSDIVRLLETIEASLRRIELTIRDLKAYETQKMIKATADRLAKPQP